MELTDVEVKLAIAKLIEVAYSTDKGMTTKITMSKGIFKLSLDEEGNAELTGAVGRVRFIGDLELQKLGLNVGMMSITLRGEEGGNVRFSGSVGPKGRVGLTVSGKFNIVDLITACSGFLCRAARFIKGRNPAAEAELQRAMGY